MSRLNSVCASAEEKFLKSLTAQHNGLADHYNQLCLDPSKQVKSRKLVRTKNKAVLVVGDTVLKREVGTVSSVLEKMKTMSNMIKKLSPTTL